MFLSVLPRLPRIEYAVERVPLRWSEFVDIQRRTECGGKFYTVDAIIGNRRIIVSVRRS